MAWVEVECDKNIKRPFLTTYKNGILVKPTGVFDGLYTTAEITYAKKLGYNIKVKQLLLFDDSTKPFPFKFYVKDMYEKKSDVDATKTYRFVYKLLLNTLYGSMGVRQDKHKIVIVNRDSHEFARIMAEEEIISQFDLYDKVILQYVDNRNLNTSPVAGAKKIKNKENFLMRLSQ
jgi:hypothetical protein